MDAGTLHQLHDARNKDIGAVADGIHFHLFAADVFVHQNRLVLVNLHGGLQVMAQMLLFCHNLHGAAAQNEAGAHQNGVADFSGCLHAGLDAGHGPAFGLRNTEFDQQFFKSVTILCLFNGIAISTDDFDPSVFQGLGQIDGSLAAQRCDHALRLLQRNNVHDILRTKRLKVEFIGCGVIGGDCFRVVIDDDGLKPCILDGLDRVDGRVVKLYALTDSDGPGPQNDDLFLFRNDGFILIFISGVEVGNIALEFRCAGVDHLVDRENALCLAHFVDIGFAA